jgi:hypothetical protein
MYTIQIAHKDKGTVVYNIYSKEEAVEKNIEYKHWTKAPLGSYAISDDGYVAKVIQKKEYSDNRGGFNIYVRMPWGYCFFNPKYKPKPFRTGGRSSNTTFTGKRPIEVKAKQKPMQDLAMAYAVTFDYDMAIETVFKNNPSQSQKRKYKRWMRTEVFKTMVQDNLKALLMNKGYGEEDIVDLLTKAMNMAEDKKDITNFLRVVENVQDMLGMRDKKVVTTEAKLTATNTRALLDELDAEEAELKAKQVTIETKSDDE